MPISPNSSALPGRPLTKSMPCCNASSRWAAVMAACAEESAVPNSAPAALRTCKPARAGLAPSVPAGRPDKKSCLTPQSTTVSAIPFCRANTLTAAPPAKKFSTICQVTSLGKADTPRAVNPWSPANTTICGSSSTGAVLPKIWPMVSAKSSRRPNEPKGLVLLFSVSCSAAVSVALEISTRVGNTAVIAISFSTKGRNISSVNLAARPAQSARQCNPPARQTPSPA